MPIYKQQGSDNWYINIIKPSGERVRKSSGTSNRQAAQEMHDQLKAEFWRIKNLGEKPRHTFEEAALRWLKEMADKASIRDDERYIKHFYGLWKGRYLDDIKRDEIIQSVSNVGNCNATQNRYLACIRAILRKAETEWEWIDKAPSIKLFREAKRRVRWITQEQAEKLLLELPEHQRSIVTFALATGLRQANVLGLKWENLDIGRRVAWVHGDESKNGKALSVPLNDTAVAVIEAQRGQHLEYVFTFRGEPINQANTRAWRTALKRAGIEDFRWHDLRHCFASWHVQGGTPLAVLQELGGWESTEMVRRYAHLSSDQLLKHSRTLDDKILSYSKKEASSKAG